MHRLVHHDPGRAGRAAYRAAAVAVARSWPTPHSTAAREALAATVMSTARSVSTVDSA